jgi:hypothetical protein
MQLRPGLYLLPFSLALALLIPLSFFTANCSAAQGAPSDKDLERQIKNLNAETKKFRSLYDSALAKSDIHNTGQEKDSKLFAEAFQNQAKNMEDSFKKTRKADPYLEACFQQADHIDEVLKSYQLGSETNAQWAKVRSELQALGKALHPPEH